MSEPCTVRDLSSGDPQAISAHFQALGCHKPVSLFERYLAEQDEGARHVLIAERGSDFAGYVTVLWESKYRPFADQQIPEVVDLNVLPTHRRRGVGSLLLQRAEERIAQHSTVAGLGVGLYADYGAAQQLYTRRGYLPDGRGVMHHNEPVEPGTRILIGDAATLMMTRELQAPTRQR